MAFRKQLHQASANFAQQPMHVRILHNQPCMCEFRTTNQAEVRILHGSPSKCEFRTAAQASANFAPAHASLVRNLLCSANST